MSSPRPSVADQLASTLRRIYAAGMTTTSGGNLSIRGTDGNLWITPAGVDKGTLTGDDVVCIQADGTCAGKHHPSSENPTHRQIYQARPDIGAIIHAHPEALVAYALAGKAPDLRAIPQARLVCGPVAIADYRLPGSDALGEVIAATFTANPETYAVIMENHGVIVAGETLDDAYLRFETLELCARALINATEINAPNPPRLLDEQQLTAFEAVSTDALTPADGWSPSTDDQNARAEVATIVDRACRLGLMIGSYGTVSMRVSDQSFVMTPNGVSRHDMKAEDMISIENGVVASGGRPSRALALHAAIFDKFPGVNAVITTQAPAVTAHAVARQTIDVSTNPESWVFVREPIKVPFGIQLHDPAQLPGELSPDRPLVIVENDCVLAIGGSLVQAFDRIEVAELTSRSNLLASRLGGAKRIGPDEIDELRKAFLG